MQIDSSLFLDRFLSYVAYDTQSSEQSDTYPSTLKQLELSKQLLLELKELGLEQVEITEHGYVFGTLPATVSHAVPTIGYVAHVDTSPEVSGKEVKPVINRNYQGGDIHLKNDPDQVIEFDQNPALAACIGHDIITTDGTTLLGADNKAGVAEIMGAVKYMIDHPEIEHGTIRVAFTVDEEVGTGTEHFDVKQFAADYAYTIDGETVGEIEDETFCADTAIIRVKGVNVHPGYAKNKMVNGIKIAARIIDQLPPDRMSPETTEKREGYLHPHAVKGGVEETEIVLLVRDFDVDGLKEKETYLADLCKATEKKYPKSTITLEIKESYRNMKLVLDQHAEVVSYAMDAVERAGLKPIKNLIRGGTDGARLCFMGVPTPNIFTGGHNFHSKKEWISVQDMAGAVATIVHLSQIWAEKSK
ncbi:MAG: peptidase T [Calditrichales bacterium]|nr:MAG: peptidase T [Calditrichales bacterium]